MIRNRLLAGAFALTLSGLAVAATTQPWTWFQDMPQPAREHAVLMKTVGEWQGTLTMYGMGPEPMEMQCTESIRAVGQFWTTSVFKGDFMGMPFEGASTTGYDPAKKKFVGTWIDSSTPSMTMMEGVWDADKNAMVMEYEGPDAMTGEIVPMRLEATHEGNSSTTVFYKTVDGKTERTMVIAMEKAEMAEAVDAASDK